MAEQPRTRLEQIMKSRDLGPTEFEREFNRRATQLGVDTSVSTSTLHRWVTGAEKPRSASRKVLEAWFEEPVTVLLGRPHTAPARTTMSVEEMIVTSGRESAEHAFETAASSLDSVAVEHLQGQVEQAARRFNTTATLAMLPELVALRDRVYQQLDRTNKPRQMTDLYLIAGQICGLIAAASLDLGYADSAEDQARAALTYGRFIEHPSLQGWARALLATVAYWSGRPRKAIEYASDGLTVATAATVRAQLHCLNARALGQVGARDEVAHHLHVAVDELDRAGGDPLFDEVGGEMQFDRLRYSVCAASAYLALGEGEFAETASSDALGMFVRGSEENRFGVLAARTDLATARTLCGDLAGAQDAIEPVLGIDSTRRTERLTQRAVALGRLLGATRFRGAAEARGLGEALEGFTQASLPRALPRPALPPSN
ncbi:MAG: hypothetical protein J2P17_19610 [Mycobacterium sp.]|nr:hypothetical protein [Mycobacterium sp.]